MAPIVHGLEIEYFGQVAFVYLDVDDPANAEFLSQLGYRYQPHIFLLDANGGIIEQWVGSVTAEQLRMAINSLLS